MRNIKKLLAVTALSLSTGVNAGNLFTCKLAGNKVASVSIDGAQIYYSYGKEGAQPDVQLDRTQNWHMGNNHYAGANYQLTFRVQKGSYNYVLYSQNYGDKLDEGLMAYNGTKVLFNKKCAEAAKVDDSVWSAQPADFGMQTDTDQVSEMVANLETTETMQAINQPSVPVSSTVTTGKLPDGVIYTYDPMTKMVSIPSVPSIPLSYGYKELKAMPLTNIQRADLSSAIEFTKNSISVEKMNTERAKAVADDQAARDAVPQIAPPADGSSPVQVKISDGNYGGTNIRVTSTVDSVTVLDVKLNRGNCVSGRQRIMNIPFGNYADYQFSSCNVLEVAVDTNMGTWTFKS